MLLQNVIKYKSATQQVMPQRTNDGIPKYRIGVKLIFLEIFSKSRRGLILVEK